LIIVGDEALLSDPTAGVLAGQETASAVFVNAQADERLAAKYGISSPLVALDVTGRTLDALGKASALSTGLGAVAAGLTACATIERLCEAVREELGELGLADDVISCNVALAKAIFAVLPAIQFHLSPPPAAAEVCRLPFEPPFRAAPSIITGGNAQQLHTGSWRVERPVVDFDRCTRCGLCFVACPDGSIALDHEGYPLIDYDHCKGCMICREVCPLEAIGAKREVRSW